MTEATLQLQQQGYLLEEDALELLKTAAGRRLWNP